MKPLRCLLVACISISPLLLNGCDSSEEGDGVAGEYETISFMVELGGETVDVLDAGGFIEVALRSDGTVDGRLVVPAALSEGEGAVDIAFGGTFVVSGDEVRFDHEEDTFIRDVVWRFESGMLSAENDNISVVLRKE